MPTTHSTNGIFYREFHELALTGDSGNIDVENVSDCLDSWANPIAQVFQYSAKRDCPQYLKIRYILFDRLVGGLLFVVTLPFLLALVAIIRLTSSGPALVYQSRVGKDGRLFVMPKLRSYYIHRDTFVPTWKVVAQPRPTPIGQALRLTHLDELPQLMNVVLGKMAILGPRPERAEVVVELAKRIPDYAERLAVLPGITGLSQVSLPPDLDLTDIREKANRDMLYINTCCWSSDIRLLAATCLFVLPFPSTTRGKLISILTRPLFSGQIPVKTMDIKHDVNTRLSGKDASMESDKDILSAEIVLTSANNPIYARGLEKYTNDLPELLKNHRRNFVAYHGERRVGVFDDFDALAARCNEENIPDGERVIRYIEPDDLLDIAS